MDSQMRGGGGKGSQICITYLPLKNEFFPTTIFSLYQFLPTKEKIGRINNESTEDSNKFNDSNELTVATVTRELVKRSDKMAEKIGEEDTT